MANRSRTRSIIRDELINFNSFQDSQLSVLNSIAVSMRDTLDASSLVNDSLSSIVDTMNSMTSTFATLESERIRFQDSQLDILNTIADSMRDTSFIVMDSLTSIADTSTLAMDSLSTIVDTSTLVSDSLSTIVDASSQLSSSLSNVISSANSSASTNMDIELEKLKFQGQMARRQMELQDTLTNSQLANIQLEEQAIVQAMEDIENATNELEFERAKQKIDSLIYSEEKKIKVNNSWIEVTDKLLEKLNTLSRNIAETANRYSELSNELITISGANDDDVRDARGEIVHDIISQLNSETKNYFNPEESYKKMIDIANSAGIGNLEEIEEITRPMLLASEAMNTNEGELATLLNRWYTRYNFSSNDMEEMLDGIRQNTAGNNATEEAVMRNIASIEDWIAYYAEGDNDKYQSMIDSLSKATSWLENMGVDSARYTEIVEKAMSGEIYTDTSLISMLSQIGLSADDLHDKAVNGGYEEAFNAIMQGESKLYEDILAGTKLKKQTADAFQYDDRSLLASYNAVHNNQNYVTPEEFEEIVEENDTSMVDLVDGKFTSVESKLKNMLSSISEWFAKWQEWTGGVAWTDLITVASGIYTVFKLRGLGSGGAGGFGSGLQGLGTKFMNSNFMANQYVNTTLTGEALGLSGTAATVAGTAITAGGVAAGGALAWDGAKTLIDDGADATEKVWAGVEAAGGTAGIAGLVALGATNPVGWVALAIGGIGFLGKRAYEEAHAMTGAAEKINSQIEDVGKSLKNEAGDQIKSITELSVKFKEAATDQEKYNVLRDSGLFTEQELQDKSVEQLEALIESYKTASMNMMEAADEVEEYFKEKYGKKVDTEVKDYIEEATKRLTSDMSEDETDAIVKGRKEFLLYALNSGKITDEKLLDKMQKAIDNETYGQADVWEDIWNGGANSWFDKHNLKDAGLDTDFFIAGDEYLKIGTDFESTEDIDKLQKYLTQYKASTTKEMADKVFDGLKEDNLYDRFMKDFSQEVSNHKALYGFKVGSNYIEEDQVAKIHEGEAVVPKQYNPSANVTELEMLRTYYKESTEKDSAETRAAISELKVVLSDIKDFLQYWRDDNIQRESRNNRVSRLNNASSIVNSYLTTI